MSKQGKKLMVMIPCLNEEKTLPAVINSIPKKIPGISKVEILVIDDGSSDNTYKVAKKLKVDYLIRHIGIKGLADSFSDGIDFCIKKGADIIVNTDGDNQYPQKDIPKLIKPILEGRAEMVIADRQTSKIRHFSIAKRIFQRLGSWIVRIVSGVNIPDAASGFRARTREAALQTNIITEFSYVIESIIQAGKKRISVVSVPITVNSKTRKSRLFKSSWGYVKNSAATVVRVFAMYEPLKVFSYIGGLFFLAGFSLGLRFLYFHLSGRATQNIQSLILAAILMIVGFQVALIGLVADLIAGNRKMIEEILYKIRSKK